MARDYGMLKPDTSTTVHAQYKSMELHTTRGYDRRALRQKYKRQSRDLAQGMRILCKLAVWLLGMTTAPHTNNTVGTNSPE